MQSICRTWTGESSSISRARCANAAVRSSLSRRRNSFLAPGAPPVLPVAEPGLPLVGGDVVGRIGEQEGHGPVVEAGDQVHAVHLPDLDRRVVVDLAGALR